MTLSGNVVVSKYYYFCYSEILLSVSFKWRMNITTNFKGLVDLNKVVLKVDPIPFHCRRWQKFPVFDYPVRYLSKTNEHVDTTIDKFTVKSPQSHPVGLDHHINMTRAMRRRRS